MFFSHGEFTKAFPVVRLTTHKLLVTVDAVVWVIFLQQTLHTNTWPLFCQILFWLGGGKDLKALSQTLRGSTLSPSIVLCSLTLNKSSNNKNFLTNLLSSPQVWGGDSLEFVLTIRGGHFTVDILPLLTSSKIVTNYVNIRPKLIFNNSGQATFVPHIFFPGISPPDC